MTTQTAPQQTLHPGLTVVITEPGIYITRNGKRARIDNINPNQNMILNGHAARGRVERTFRGKLGFRGFEIWHVSGRLQPLEEHPLDIIRKEDLKSNQTKP